MIDMARTSLADQGRALAIGCACKNGCGGQVSAGQFCGGPVQGNTQMQAGQFAGYVPGQDVWDNLYTNVKGTRFDPAGIFSLPAANAPPANVSADRWGGFVDGVTYGGARAGLSGLLAGLVIGVGSTLLAGLGMKHVKRHRHKGQIVSSGPEFFDVHQK